MDQGSPGSEVRAQPRLTGVRTHTHSQVTELDQLKDIHLPPRSPRSPATLTSSPLTGALHNCSPAVSLCCPPSKPGKFMVFVQMAKYSWSCWDVWHAFIHGWATHCIQAVCLSACLMSWPLLPSMAPIMAPVPLHVSHHHCPQQGVLTCLSTRGEQSQKTARTLHNIT